MRWQKEQKPVNILTYFLLEWSRRRYGMCINKKQRKIKFYHFCLILIRVCLSVQSLGGSANIFFFLYWSAVNFYQNLRASDEQLLTVIIFPSQEQVLFWIIRIWGKRICKSINFYAFCSVSTAQGREASHQEDEDSPTRERTKSCFLQNLDHCVFIGLII